MTDVIQLTQEWVALALADRSMAQRALEIAPALPRQACFHSQQAVEKVLKAYLTYHGVVFEKTHSIARLCTLGATIDPAFGDVGVTYDRLSDYAVEFRYPDSEEPTTQEMNEALAIADQAIGFVLRHLPATCVPPESGVEAKREPPDDPLP